MPRLSTAVLVSMIAACAALLAARQLSRPQPCDPDNGGLAVPPGFCAAVIADNLGRTRHMAVASNGDLYVELHDDNAPGGAVVALRDTDGDGRFDGQQHFGPGLGGSAIAWRNNQLYVGADTKIVRFQMHSADNRFSTGIRHTVGVAWDTTTHSL